MRVIGMEHKPIKVEEPKKEEPKKVEEPKTIKKPLKEEE